ncbi:MAG: bifunctional riboflavin kinase/FAD synthetase [Psychrilyobacter sp.]|nr:bifunctional riboflavin kinase/FAD synthetase [Psychrilyobacter sp.]
MIVLENINQLNNINQKLCVAIGAFDGIHQGHRDVIKSAIKRAKKINGRSVVFTFENHPKNFPGEKKIPKLINSKDEKIHLLEKLGVDYIVFQTFNKEFSKMTPLEFIKTLELASTSEIFVGFNFRFGAGGAADVSDMITLGDTCNIKVNKINPVKNKDILISSTMIRELIKLGELEKVKKLLGYNLFIIGEVVHGKKYGREMGFPTANLKIINKIYPPFGIYGGKVKIEKDEKSYDCVVNIGRNPTLKDGELSVEVHILEFDEYIYGKKLTLELVRYLREEKKFGSVEELKNAISNDVLIWKEYIK